MRRNKTYSQQKKYYDESDIYDTLGSIFYYWLECGNTKVKDIQATYRECNRECKEQILDELFNMCDPFTFYNFVCIFNFGHK